MSLINFLEEQRKEELDAIFETEEEFNPEKIDALIGEGVDRSILELAEETLEEAEYNGKKVELRKPFRNGDGPKKFSVYVKNDEGNVIKVNFGSEDMEIKRDDPEARKSFRARHKCDTADDETTGRYWSCRMWQKGKSVSDMLAA